VLEVAHRLAKAGFGIRFDPGDKERGQKVPDLQVTNSATGEDLYVEVSTLGPAVAERDAVSDDGANSRSSMAFDSVYALARLAVL